MDTLMRRLIGTLLCQSRPVVPVRKRKMKIAPWDTPLTQ
uniref:Uncharacterized protein n=1 Tax=Arundo donax TaxID=35708 RepID=A0A0A9BDC2_ARUDO